LKVRRQPRIAIITVGDEVQLPGKPLIGAQIYNCNRFMLDAACRSLGIIPTFIHHAPDNREVLRHSLGMALTMCDMLLTAGGISTGEFDFVQSELTALGINKHFWSIAQKPGKPLYFGTSHEGKAVFALPGNPISAIVCFAAYVVEAFALMQGKTQSNPRFTAMLAEPFPTDKKRYRFLPGMLWVDRGQLFCKAASKIESHMITSLSGANCLLEAEAAQSDRVAGELITCTMLPWGKI
jgi:molybdopterin molybdotransferase